MSKKKKINMRGYTVLIEAKKIEEKTESGIIISRMNKAGERLEQHRVLEGVVLQLGTLAYTDKYNPVLDTRERWCNVGDTVYYRQYAGKYIPDPNDPDIEYIVLNDEDIICTITESEE